MAVFKCPICGRFHAVREYDKTDYICTNSIAQKRKFQDMLPEDLLSRRAWNFNKCSTREDEYRDVTIINIRTLSEINKHHGGNCKNY